MPVATTSNVTVRYPPAKDAFDDADEQESYQLLELPAEILKAIESGEHETFPLTIKGRPTDDAVLCTPTTTYSVRTITVSNSFVVLRAPAASIGKDGAVTTLEIRDTCKEVLECNLIAPRLERIRKVLHESRWEGLGNEQRPAKRKRYSKAQLESTVQASESQLDVGLKQRNVIEVDNKLLYLAPADLYPLLSIILSLLSVHHTSKSLKTGEAHASCEAILQALELDHRVSRDVSHGVLKLFGEVVDSDGLQEWKCNVDRVVRELGIGLLHALGHKQQPSNTFEDEWKEQVGDTWEELVDLKTLDGNYLLTPVPISFTSTASAPLISAFFVHTLSTDPATRFGDLFLTRPKWRPEDMKPFLHGLTPDGDQKGMDRMIVKFVRVVKESNGGVWWHPRRSV